ncbi:hypothetical protein YC2023_039969 [Brassica napus]
MDIPVGIQSKLSQIYLSQRDYHSIEFQAAFRSNHSLQQELHHNQMKNHQRLKPVRPVATIRSRSFDKNQKRIDRCDDKTGACNEIDRGRGRAQDSPWLSSGFTIAELKVAAMEFERVDELGIQGLALSSEITAVKECRYGKDTCGQENCVIEERIVEKIVMDKILLVKRIMIIKKLCN